MVDEAMLDEIARSAAWGQHCGWHDDHREHDGTPEYRPAVMQVRSEFVSLARLIDVSMVANGRALQLGLGFTAASHGMFQGLFAKGCVTFDRRECRVGDHAVGPGMELRATATRKAAEFYAPYSFLFCDAEHGLEGVRRDYDEYAPLVMPGGIVAIHDALRREAYPEVEVWRFVAELGQRGITMNVIGEEVGIAWTIKRW